MLVFAQTNQTLCHPGGMELQPSTHPTPPCATMSATPLARDEMTEIQANGNTPRRSWQTVVAEGGTKKPKCVCSPSYWDDRPSGIRLTRSLRAAGGRVNVPGGVAIPQEAPEE